MSWRRMAVCMTAACGGLLMAQGAYLGGVLLLAVAVALAVVTEVRI